MARLALALAVLVHTAPRTPGNAAVASCKKALAEVPSLDPRARAVHVQLGCGALYADKNCRGAWNDVAGTPKLFPERWAHLQKWCSEAYCPRLAEPQPALCDPRSEATEAAWLELNRAVLKLEGAEPGLADALAGFFLEPETAGWPAPAVEVRAGAPAATVVVFAADGGSRPALPLSGTPDAEQLAALRKVLAPLCRGAATVRSEKGLPLRILRPVFTATTDAGCEYQTFETLK